MENKKRALGRGLEQLFNTENLDIDSIEKQIYESASHEEVMELNLDDLRPNPYQPRKVFKDEALKELAASIATHGVFQPIIVKKAIKGYEIIAGERRVRASKLAGMKTIPGITRQFNDDQMMEIALLENLQRENLNPIEEAYAYKMMLERLELTQDELAKRVGKSRSHLTNILGILRLPREVQEMVVTEQLTMSHARVLSKFDDYQQIMDVARQIIEQKLPVHDVEQLANNNKISKTNKVVRKEADNQFKYVEDLLREKLDARVKIKEKKIEINFSNVADLNRILEIMNIKE